MPFKDPVNQLSSETLTMKVSKKLVLEENLSRFIQLKLVVKLE